MTTLDATRTRIPVVGMDCADCAKTLERALSDTEGVSSAQVRFESGAAVVEHDPAIASEAVLARVIEQAGYRVGGEAGETCTLTFDVTGIDCADCAKSAHAAVAR